jgi:hypothetical protein
MHLLSDAKLTAQNVLQDAKQAEMKEQMHAELIKKSQIEEVKREADNEKCVVSHPNPCPPTHPPTLAHTPTTLAHALWAHGACSVHAAGTSRRLQPLLLVFFDGNLSKRDP